MLVQNVASLGWEGIFSELTDNDIYVAFDAGIRFFPRHAMEKDYYSVSMIF